MKIERKLSVVLTFVISYLCVLYGALVASPLLLFVVIVYCLITICVAIRFYNKDAANTLTENLEFDREYPFSRLGGESANFLHIFSHKEDVLAGLLKRIGSDLKENCLISNLSEMSVTDTDKELGKRDKRSFHRGSSEPTIRETILTLVLYTETIGRMQTIKWWIFSYGYKNWNLYFAFIASSPLTLPFWIIPYFRNRFHPCTKIRTIHPGFYGSLDLWTRVRCIQNNVFDTLVSVLDENGIDTSDLKLQRASVMNISVSGGKLNMGTVMQGAMNKVLNKEPVS